MKPKSRGNGQGTVIKRGNTYTAIHRISLYGEIKSHSKGGFKTKKEAIQWLANNKVETSIVPLTVGEIYDAWSVVHYENISAKKVQAYQAAYKCVLSLKNRRYNDVSLSEWQSCVNRAYNSYNQRKTVKTVLNQLEAFAIRNGITDKQIMQYIELPKQESPDKHPFTSEEVSLLQSAWETGNSMAGAILIMIYTGMRYGEISTIKPENIHIEEGYMLGGIKTEAGKHGEIIIVDAIKPIVSALMLPVNTIGYMETETFRHHFTKCIADIGCSKHTPHECRHTTATLLAEAGVHPSVIKEIMRHTNYSQTLEYTHIDRKTKAENLSKILI